MVIARGLHVHTVQSAHAHHASHVQVARIRSTCDKHTVCTSPTCILHLPNVRPAQPLHAVRTCTLHTHKIGTDRLYERGYRYRLAKYRASIPSPRRPSHSRDERRRCLSVRPAHGRYASSSALRPRHADPLTTFWALGRTSRVLRHRSPVADTDGLARTGPREQRA